MMWIWILMAVGLGVPLVIMASGFGLELYRERNRLRVSLSRKRLDDEPLDTELRSLHLRLKALDAPPEPVPSVIPRDASLSSAQLAAVHFARRQQDFAFASACAENRMLSQMAAQQNVQQAFGLARLGQAQASGLVGLAGLWETQASGLLAGKSGLGVLSTCVTDPLTMRIF